MEKIKISTHMDESWLHQFNATQGHRDHQKETSHRKHSREKSRGRGSRKPQKNYSKEWDRLNQSDKMYKPQNKAPQTNIFGKPNVWNEEEDREIDKGKSLKVNMKQIIDNMQEKRRQLNQELSRCDFSAGESDKKPSGEEIRKYGAVGAVEFDPVTGSFRAAKLEALPQLVEVINPSPILAHVPSSTLTKEGEVFQEYNTFSPSDIQDTNLSKKDVDEELKELFEDWQVFDAYRKFQWRFTDEQLNTMRQIHSQFYLQTKEYIAKGLRIRQLIVERLFKQGKITDSNRTDMSQIGGEIITRGRTIVHNYLRLLEHWRVLGKIDDRTGYLTSVTSLCDQMHIRMQSMGHIISIIDEGSELEIATSNNLVIVRQLDKGIRDLFLCSALSDKDKFVEFFLSQPQPLKC